MPPNPSDEDLAMLTDEERAAVTSTEPEDDPASLQQLAGDGADDGAGASDGNAASTADTSTANAGTTPATPAPTTAPAPAEPDTSPYSFQAPADAKGRLDTLQGQLDEAFSKLMDGDLSADDYRKQQREAQEQIDAIKASLVKHEISQEMQQQAALQTWERACENFAAFAKRTDGVDYFSNKILGQAWDAEIKRLAADSANAHKDENFFLSEAHKAVLAAIGRTPSTSTAPTPPAPSAAPRAPDLEKVPPTIGRLPPAMDASTQGDEFAHLRNLEGDDYERAIAKLSAEQLDRFMGS
jgi:hypothetical protein